MDLIALTIALPLALLGLSLISSWSEQDRVREALLDGDVLELGFAFGRRRRVPLNRLSDWKLERVAVFATGRNGTNKIKGAGITVREDPDGVARPAGEGSRRGAARRKWVFVVDQANIDLDAFRAFAPVVIADLEGKRARQGAREVYFTILMPERTAPPSRGDGGRDEG